MNYVPRSPQVPIYLHIRQYVQAFNNKRNQKSIMNEVQQLLSQLGVPGEQYFLVQMLEAFDIPKEKNAQSQKYTFLNSWFQMIIAKSHFLDYFSVAIEQVCPSAQSATEYVNELCNCLKLPPTTQLIMYLSLTYSAHPVICKEGLKMFKKKLHDYYIQGKPQPMPNYVLHAFMYQIRNVPDLNEQESEVKFFLESVLGQRTADLKPLFEDTRRQSVKWIDLNNVIELPKLSECISPLDLLKEIGPSCCSSVKELTMTLADLHFSEEDIIQCLLHMANHVQILEDQAQRDVTHLFAKVQAHQDWESLINEAQSEKKVQLNWDIDVFLHYCMERVPQLRWMQVIEKLDRPNLTLPEQKTFLNFMAFVAKMKKLQNFPFPQRLFLEKWANRKSQLVFIGHMLRVGRPEQTYWAEITSKRWVQMDFVPNFKPQSLQPVAMQFWSNLDFFQMMVEMSEGYVAEVRELFDYPIKHNADLVMISLAQIQPTCGGALIDEVFTALFPNYVSQHANSVQVLECLWKYNENLVISGICELYRKELGKKDNSCLNLSRVLDITQGISQNQQHTVSLLAMAHCADHHFSVPLGVLAGKREFLNFDRWLQERIKVGGIHFVQILMAYLEENVITPVKEHQSKLGLPSGQLGQMNMSVLDNILEKGQLKLEMITIIFEQLMSQGDKLGLKLKAQTQQFYKDIVQVFPQLAGPPNQKANQEVERLTDNYFNMYYNDQITLDSLLNLMVQWKTTGSFQDKEVYACIITNLYNEYQYHTKYPLKELQLTGSLFGGVIDRGLVEGKSLQIGLQIIVVSLMNTNIRYEFSIRALEMIKNKVYEWPQFADQILQCEQLQTRNLDMMIEIARQCEKHGIAVPAGIIPQPVVVKQVQVIIPPVIVQPPPVQQPAPQPIQPQQLPSQQQVPISIQQLQQQFPTLQQQHSQPAQSISQQPIIPTLQSSITPPPQHSKTLSQSVASTPQPIKTKSETPSLLQQTLSFKEVLNLEFEDSGVFGIDDNVKQKVTFILNNISIQNLEEYAVDLRTRFEKGEIQKWFVKSFAYVRIPKTTQLQKEREVNILYQLLYAINKPRLFQEISRELSIGLTKILKYSRPTPTQDDRNTLKQMGSFLGQVTLHRNKPLLNKYFDYRALLEETQLTVHALCKIIEWSSQSTIFTQNNKWLHNILKELDIRKDGYPTMVKYEIINLIKFMDYKAEPIPQEIQRPKVRTPQPDFPELNITHLPQYVVLDPKYLNGQMAEGECRGLIASALDKAISDIIPPVISRSVTIALITTRELVFKDFSQEPNEKLMLRGMHMIATHLSGSLAMVTCREPLKARIQHYLKELLKDNKKMEEKVKEQVIQAASGENLDLGCALIKKAVIERALDDVNNDPAIIQELEKRKMYKDKSIPYRDEQMQLMLQFLPESLQPKSNGLTEEEIRIYEEFGQRRAPQQKTQIQRVQMLCQLMTDPQQNECKIQTLIDEILQSAESVADTFYNDLGDKFINLLLFNSLTTDKIQFIFQQINTLVQRITTKTNLKWSDIIYSFLEQHLDKLDTSPMWWCAFPIMLRRKYIGVADLEKILMHVMHKDTQLTVNGVVCILRQVIITEEQIPYNQTKGILKEISNRKQTHTQVGKFLQELSSWVQNNQGQKVNKKIILLQNPIYSQFDQNYMELVQQQLLNWFSLTTEQEISIFLNEFNLSDDFMLKFCAYSIEICVNTKSNERQVIDHSQIEQLAKLFTVLVRTMKSGFMFFEKLMEASVLVLTKMHEITRIQFNQRPLHKLIYNLLCDFQDTLFKETEIENLYTKIGHFLERTEPNLYPGFCFGWLELLSNRYFITIINFNHKLYAKLMIKLLEFLREIATEENLNEFKYVQEFLKGVYRLFVVLLSDFPKLLCTYALQFADEVPFNQVQLLNMCLAAYLNKDTQSPLTCSTIYEIEDCQNIAPISHASLDEPNFTKIKEDIQQLMNCSDEELKMKVPKYFDNQDKNRVPLHVSGFFIVLPRMDIQRKECQKFLQRILRAANLPQKQLILNVILNQIRFPEKVTEFYIKFVHSLFIQGDNAQIQEQTATLITQRLIVENPKTWGMLYLHEELLRTSSQHNLYLRFQVHRNDQI